MGLISSAIDFNIDMRKVAFELAARQMLINTNTLPDILKNAQTIYEWLTK